MRDHELVEVVRDELADLPKTCLGATVQAADALMLPVQKYCNDVLCTYHELDDPSQIPNFVQIFARLMQLRGKVQDFVDSKLKEQIGKAVSKRYKVLFEQAVAENKADYDAPQVRAGALDSMCSPCRRTKTD